MGHPSQYSTTREAWMEQTRQQTYIYFLKWFYSTSMTKPFARRNIILFQRRITGKHLELHQKATLARMLRKWPKCWNPTFSHWISAFATYLCWAKVDLHSKAYHVNHIIMCQGRNILTSNKGYTRLQLDTSSILSEYRRFKVLRVGWDITKLQPKEPLSNKYYSTVVK